MIQWYTNVNNDILLRCSPRFEEVKKMTKESSSEKIRSMVETSTIFPSERRCEVDKEILELLIKIRDHFGKIYLTTDDSSNTSFQKI